MTSSKTLSALSHLQEYADTSEKAHEALKSSIWQLTKSRRNVRSGILGVDSTKAYTAALLREELRAQIRVIENDDDDDIPLVQEDSPKPKASCPPREWKIQNLVDEGDGGPSSSWTMVQEDDFDEENEKIIRTDPIKLFGGYFTARELKVAQQKAMEALDGYIQAANEAAKILALLEETRN